MTAPAGDRVLTDPSGSVTITFSYPDDASCRYVIADTNGKELDSNTISREAGDDLLSQYVSMNWSEDNPPAAEPATAVAADPAAGGTDPAGDGPPSF